MSVTVSVTVLAPISAQVNAVFEAEIEKSQLSVYPPSISAATIDAFPEASS